MSRKNKQHPAAVVDTGGLNLNQFTPSTTVVETPAVQSNVLFGGLDLASRIDCSHENHAPNLGLPLFRALEQSDFLRMATRPTSRADIIVVSNGSRFWTALLDFTPEFVEGIAYNDDTERVRTDWRPVVGSAAGMRVG